MTNTQTQVAIVPRILSSRMAAAYLNRSPITLRKWRRCGLGPVFVLLNGRPVYRPDDLDRFIETLASAPQLAARAVEHN